MKYLKYLFALSCLGLFLWACASNPVKKNTEKEEPVVIANDSLEYEIIIIDVGFNYYLNAVAQPPGYYSQKYLENQNRIMVANWNYRVGNPQQYNPNLYWNTIEYFPNIDYGYEVNYKLFNYFIFAQNKYKINLRGNRPNRIN
ncbi:MAG: hypothetical protein CMB99_04180 [Flavobacteriaceae bacterium]|nr:hypothetical protein [Flavobacteriaceae bacterium]|tara:strand:+ start:6744 stop:7172 length:429 start_codon:yes stop_codon:yes gene_type:complete